MAWVKIDDHFDEHPKMQRVGPLGWGVWLAGLSYCNRNLTDGFIPWSKAQTLCSFQVVEEDGMIWDLARGSGYSGEDVDASWVIGLLIDAGLWEEVQNGKGRIEGYRIHDYEDYQPSKDQTLTEREKATERKRKSRSRTDTPEKESEVTDVSQRDTLNVTDVSRNGHKPPDPVPVVNSREVKRTSTQIAADPAAAIDLESKKPTKPDVKRPDQRMYDAFKAEYGYEPGNQNERSRWNKANLLCREAGVMPEDVPRLHAAYRRKYSHAADTVMAMANHAGELLADSRASPAVEDRTQDWTGLAARQMAND